MNVTPHEGDDQAKRVADCHRVTSFQTIVFEFIDITATLAATWALLRMVIARPAIRGWRPMVGTSEATAPNLVEATDESGAVEPDEPPVSERGISWPQSAWTRLAA
jgi:hypothetical protein